MKTKQILSLLLFPFVASKSTFKANREPEVGEYVDKNGEIKRYLSKDDSIPLEEATRSIGGFRKNLDNKLFLVAHPNHKFDGMLAFNSEDFIEEGKTMANCYNFATSTLSYNQEDLLPGGRDFEPLVNGNSQKQNCNILKRNTLKNPKIVKKEGKDECLDGQREIFTYVSEEPLERDSSRKDFHYVAKSKNGKCYDKLTERPSREYECDKIDIIGDKKLSYLMMKDGEVDQLKVVTGSIYRKCPESFCFRYSEEKKDERGIEL